MKTLITALGVALCAAPVGAQAFDARGIVVDAKTRRPIAGAVVTAGATTVRSGRNGAFAIGSDETALRVRAAGYARRTVDAAPFEAARQVIALERVTPRAVYLSLSDVEGPAREQVLRLPRSTRVNAFVVTLKSRSGTPLLAGAKDVLASIRDRGLYAIAILPVFKDSHLAAERPQSVLRSSDGEELRDNDGQVWMDPQDEFVRDYNLRLAEEAAQAGFDEIQFDYVRFPSTLSASNPRAGMRRHAIRSFLRTARERLASYNVFIAADLFGFSSWDRGDTNIGQNLEEVAREVDYVCLMLYPSAFKRGLPGAPSPLERPDLIVALSLAHAKERTGLPSLRFRPWLQAFRDYNFDRRPFRREEIAAQVRAAEKFGAHGWMLYNRYSRYDPKDLPAPALQLGRRTPWP